MLGFRRLRLLSTLGLVRAGGAAAFNPASLFTASLGDYWDFRAPGGVYESTDTSTPGAVGNPVGRYTGLLNGKHATEAANKPTLRADGIEFTSTSSHVLNLPDFISAWGAGTVIIAIKCPSETGSGGTNVGQPLAGFGADASGDHYPFTDGNIYLDTFSTVRKTMPDPGALVNWHTIDIRSALNSWTFCFNGTTVTTTGVNAFGAGAAPKFGGNNGAGNFFGGHIGRAIVIDRVLAGAELDNARAWVAAGYA